MRGFDYALHERRSYDTLATQNGSQLQPPPTRHLEHTRHTPRVRARRLIRTTRNLRSGEARCRTTRRHHQGRTQPPRAAAERLLLKLLQRTTHMGTGESEFDGSSDEHADHESCDHCTRQTRPQAGEGVGYSSPVINGGGTAPSARLSANRSRWMLNRKSCRASSSCAAHTRQLVPPVMASKLRPEVDVERTEERA